METKTRGQRIAHLRKQHGWSQAELGEKVGVTKAAVSKWEAAASPDIALDTFFLLAEKLSVDPRELATGKRAPGRSSADLPQRRIDLIRMYGRLPFAVRQPIRQLIETLAAAQNDRYQAWAREQQELAKKRGEIA